MEFIKTTYRPPASLVKLWKEFIEKYSVDEKLFFNCLIAQEVLDIPKARIMQIEENYPEYFKLEYPKDIFSYEKQDSEKLNAKLFEGFAELLKAKADKIGITQNLLIEYILLKELTEEREYRMFRHIKDAAFKNYLIENLGIMERVKYYEVPDITSNSAGEGFLEHYADVIERYRQIHRYGGGVMLCDAGTSAGGRVIKSTERNENSEALLS